MSDARPGRPRSLQILLGILLLGCLGGLFWRLGMPHPSTAQPEAGAGDEPTPGAAQSQDVSVARVRGRILLEQLEPQAEGETDASALDETATDETDAETTSPAPFDPPVGPEPVELEPPPAGSCRITAWQDGTRVSETVTCAEDGSFEVPLRPGVAGVTAFELEVPGRLRAVVQADVPAGGVGRLPPVALGLGSTLRGQVVDREGEPISGAQIEAMPQPNLDEPEPWRTRSDETGSFELDTLPAGPVAVRAIAPGHTAAVTEAIVPADDVVVVLDALHDLRGRVVAPPELLVQAKVRIEGSAIWPARQSEVDPSDGTFSFEEVPDGVYALEAWTEDPGTGQPFASIPLENVTPDLTVSLALVPAARVPVVVTDRTGEPVAGARVSLSNSSVGLLAKVATTDETGQATPGPVVPGPYIVRADAEGFLPSDPVELIVTGEADPEEVVIALPRPGRIEGIVVDDEGHPVPRALVEVRSDALFSVGESQARADTFRSALRAAGSLGVTKGPVPEIPAFGDDIAELGEMRSDDDGRFVLTGLVPGEYTLQASHGRYATSDPTPVRIEAGEMRTGIELVVRSGHRLTGRVVDANDQPIEHAIVEVDDGTAYATDDRGLFDAGMRRGGVVLVARAPHKAPRRATVRMAGRDRDVEIILPDAVGELHGRVENANGQPVQDVRVTVQMTDGLSPTEFAFTDDRGLWRIDSLSEGTAEVDIEGAGFLPETRRVQVAERTDPIDVQLRTGWTLEVFARVLGRDIPIEGARVTAGGQLAVTDAEGIAVFEPLAQDRVRVEVEAEGYGPASAVAHRPEGDRGDLTLDLEEGGSMSGLVLDYRGDPVAGARIVVRAAATGEVLARTATSVRGQWSVQGIPEGDVRVEASPPQNRSDELAEVALDSDVLRGHVTQDVDLRFDRR